MTECRWVLARVVEDLAADFLDEPALCTDAAYSRSGPVSDLQPGSPHARPTWALPRDGPTGAFPVCVACDGGLSVGHSFKETRRYVGRCVGESSIPLLQGPPHPPTCGEQFSDLRIHRIENVLGLRSNVVTGLPTRVPHAQKGCDVGD
jgi:hypothetical protein